MRVRLSGCVQEEKELLEDLYSVSGDALIPQKERFDVYAFEESSDVRESIPPAHRAGEGRAAHRHGARRVRTADDHGGHARGKAA